MPGGRPTKKSKARTPYNRKAVERMLQAWELWLGGHSLDAIAHKLGCAWETTKKDIERAKAMQEASALLRIEDDREAAVRDRRHLKKLALEDRAEAAPQHRGPLLGEARKNQQGIEELQNLHPKEPAAPVQAGVFLIKVGDGEPQQLKDLSDEELARVAEQAEADLAQLEAPAPDPPPDP